MDQDQNRDQAQIPINLIEDFAAEADPEIEALANQFAENVHIESPIEGDNSEQEQEDNNPDQDPSDFENTNMSAPNPVHLFLGVQEDVLATDRTVEDISQASKEYPKENRDTLKASDMKAWYRMKDNCKKGISDPFTVIRPVSIDSDLESLKGTHHVRTLLQELKRSIIQADMQGVFLIPHSFDADGKPNTMSFTNMLDGIGTLKEESVLMAMKFYIRKSPKTYHVENAAWSGEKILNSCDEELKPKLKECVENIPEDLVSGPIYLYWLNKLIISTSEKALRTLLDKLEKLRLKQIDGEDVQKAGQYIRAVVKILDAHNSTPSDLHLFLFRTFQDCSTDEFVQFVQGIERKLELDHLFSNAVQKLIICYKQLLSQFEAKYLDLLDRGEWVAKSVTKGQDSSFNVNEGKKETICFNCGKLGHTVPNCDKPRDDDTIRRYSEILQAKREERTGGRGRGTRNRGGRGRGNGGRGKGGNPTDDSQKKQTTPKNENTPKELRQPPKAGEEHEKVIGSHEKCKWNGQLGKWEKIPSGGGGNGGNDSSNQSSSSNGDTANTAGATDTNPTGDRVTIATRIIPGANFS
ncbi:hypothetical protein CTEN210_17638 [Chaetoceros tenuissimus]|uniref:CCHC-type domain-containing protein n=1 Tax=Chaetoceros tenuissimus TaxID=426638 RepID=A0AAD3DBX4_9STRA|nr:hypothetical protein CTEN210_17638 [Chaetoceros tenuissimus]